MQACEDATNGEHAVKAINYNLGLLDFTILIFCQFEMCSKVVASIKADFNQVAICGIKSKPSGMLKFLSAYILTSVASIYRSLIRNWLISLSVCKFNKPFMYPQVYMHNLKKELLIFFKHNLETFDRLFMVFCLVRIIQESHRARQHHGQTSGGQVWTSHSSIQAPL